MDSLTHSLVREALLLVSAQKLITDFDVKGEEIQVVLLDGTRIQQSVPSAIAFVRGLLEGVKIAQSKVEISNTPSA